MGVQIVAHRVDLALRARVGCGDIQVFSAQPVQREQELQEARMNRKLRYGLLSLLEGEYPVERSEEAAAVLRREAQDRAGAFKGGEDAPQFLPERTGREMCIRDMDSFVQSLMSSGLSQNLEIRQASFDQYLETMA